MVGHHGAMATEAVKHRGQDTVAFIPGKINVDIRRVKTARIEEAFEVEVVADGADIGDGQAIGHKRGSARTPATGAGNRANDLMHHQEIGGKTHGRD